MRPPVYLLLIALGGPVGYFAGSTLTPSPDEPVPDSPPPVGAAPVSPFARDPSLPLPPMITGKIEGSAMLVEWERLNAQSGGEFANLFAHIKDTEDAFRRRTFRAAALAEWVARDPKGTLTFLRVKDKWMATQLVREWLRTNPNAAIDQLLADGAASKAELSSLLEEIAKLAPDRLAEICAKSGPTIMPDNPQNSSSSSLNPEKAFAAFAEKDLDAARLAAESLTGTMRDKAMAGVGGAWAEKDGVAALAWAEKLPPGTARNAVLQSVLAGWAKTDPFAALGKLDLLPKPANPNNNNGSNSQNNAVTLVLAEASKKDWYATMTWLQEHPEKAGNDVINGLSSAFSRRLKDDPIPMMRDILAGSQPILSNVFASAIQGEGLAQRDAIWSWLKTQPDSATTENLRFSLLNAVAYKDPAAVFDLVRTMPASPPIADPNSAEANRDRQQLRQLVANMFNSGDGGGDLDAWFDKAPASMRPYLLEYGLSNSPESISTNPTRWVEQLSKMPAEVRARTVPSLASGWASNDPDAAAKWALGLTDTNERANAFSSVAHVWVQNDNESFAKVLETLPQGPNRDQGTAVLAQSLVQTSPEVAWDWSAEIQDENTRLQSMGMVYGYYATRNPSAAAELLNRANLSEAQIKQLQQYRGRGFQSGFNRMRLEDYDSL